MKPVAKSFVFLALVSLSLVTTMADAAAPSVEVLEKHIQSASRAVDFSHVSGSETPNSTEIAVKPHSKMIVRLVCAPGYRGVLLSVHEGSMGLGESPERPLSSEDVLALVDGAPKQLRDIKVHQPVPYNVSNGLGLLGAPVPYVSVVEVGESGDYTIMFSIMRLWMPNSGTRYALKIHVAEEETEPGNLVE